MGLSNNAILSEEELAAALAEVEKLSGQEASAIPSLDEVPAPVLVPVPTVQNVKSAAESRKPTPIPAAAPSSGNEKKATPPPSAAAPATAAPPPVTATPEQATRPRQTLMQLLYRIADAALDWINWPLVRLSEGMRALVGAAALTTIVVSLLAWLVLPLLQPERDPLGFLKRRTAAASAAGAAAHEEPAKSAEHGGGH